jgi:hypothetical protein
MKKLNVPNVTTAITVTPTNRRSPAMSSPRKSSRVLIVTTLLCLVVVALPKAALAYNAAGDFSTSSNPNGV